MSPLLLLLLLLLGCSRGRIRWRARCGWLQREWMGRCERCIARPPARPAVAC